MINTIPRIENFGFICWSLLLIDSFVLICFASNSSSPFCAALGNPCFYMVAQTILKPRSCDHQDTIWGQSSRFFSSSLVLVTIVFASGFCFKIKDDSLQVGGGPRRTSSVVKNRALECLFDLRVDSSYIVLMFVDGFVGASDLSFLYGTIYPAAKSCKWGFWIRQSWIPKFSILGVVVYTFYFGIKIGIVLLLAQFDRLVSKILKSPFDLEFKSEVEIPFFKLPHSKNQHANCQSQKASNMIPPTGL